MKTFPYLPVGHPFVGYLIESVHRELLDRTLSWNSANLERKLNSFRRHYNKHRVHGALHGQTPAEVEDNRRRKQVGINSKTALPLISFPEVIPCRFA